MSRGFADRIADRVIALFGSWSAFGFHTVWFGFWFVRALDVGLLTNLVSLEAIYLQILILIAQRRIEANQQAQAERDRQREESEANEVHAVDLLQEEQMQILRDHTDELRMLRALLEGKSDGQKQS